MKELVIGVLIAVIATIGTGIITTRINETKIIHLESIVERNAEELEKLSISLNEVVKESSILQRDLQAQYEKHEITGKNLDGSIVEIRDGLKHTRAIVMMAHIENKDIIKHFAQAELAAVGLKLEVQSNTNEGEITNSYNAAISWEIPSSRSNGDMLLASDIKGYQVYIATSDGTYDEIIEVNDPTKNNVNIVGLSEGKDVYFAVVTKDKDGEIILSSGIEALTSYEAAN